MKILTELLQGVKTAAIAGHIRPDGDCVGSCMGLWLYLRDNFPQIAADVYLEEPRTVFGYIEGIQEIHGQDEGKDYDVMFLLDVSGEDRIGVVNESRKRAKKTICIDHHVTNPGIADENYILADISSTSEVLYGMLEPEKVSTACAEAIYTGIIHDSGVFQYSCTKPQTLRIAADLIEKGVRATQIIEKSFNQKTYVQNQIMGRTLMESIMLLDGRCIVGIVRIKEMRFYGVEPKDLDGIVSQLRNTTGVETAIFLYEIEPQVFKVSLRSTERVDVSAVAAFFGGGGHVRAAGCTMHGTPYDVVNNLTVYIEKQLVETEKNND